MLREGWGYFSAALIVIGLITQNAAVVTLGFAVVIACSGATLWARYSLRRVLYERLIPEDHAFAGERLGVTLRITNRKPLPLPWIEAREQFPEDMLPAEPGGDFHPHLGSVALDWRTSVGSYERVSRTVEVHCPARGIFRIGPTNLRSGDAFGLFTDERDEERASHIVVYPRTVDIGDLALPARRPYGETGGGMRVFEDPARVSGIRDYRPGDSLRRIDWNATARLNKLQSRVYEPTSSQQLLVCLNTQTVIPAWAGYIPDVLEHSITIAASIARDAYDQRYSVGLLANSSFPESNRMWTHRGADALADMVREKELRARAGDARASIAAAPQRKASAQGSIRIPPGRRAEQFIRVLEALAVVTPFVLEPLSALLDREEHRLRAGTTIAVVTGIMPSDLAETLLRLRRRGHQIVVLSSTGEAWPEQLGDITVRDTSHLLADFAPPTTSGDGDRFAPMRAVLGDRE